MKRLFPALIPACALLSGCATRIDQVTIATVPQGQPIPVTVSVTPFQTTPRAPEVFTHPAVPGGTFQSDGRLSTTGTNQYGGNLPARSYGTYRLRVDVPYRIALFGVERVASKEQDFSVDVPAGGFSFDGPGIEGWRMKGIFNSNDLSAQVSTCPPLDSEAFATAAANFPEPASGHRGLAWPLGPNCFPAALPGGASWVLDFVSPNLENRPGWAGQTSFTFHINSHDAQLVPNGLKVQGLLKVRRSDNTETLLTEPGASGAARSEIVPDGWSTFTFTFAPPANSRVIGVVIRVLGVPAVRSSDDAVQIDGVVPGS